MTWRVRDLNAVVSPPQPAGEWFELHSEPSALAAVDRHLRSSLAEQAYFELAGPLRRHDRSAPGEPIGYERYVEHEGSPDGAWPFERGTVRLHSEFVAEWNYTLRKATLVEAKKVTAEANEKDRR